MNDNERDYIEALFTRHPKATKVLLDANIFNYALLAQEAIGINLFAFLTECEDVFNWYVIQFEANNLLKSGKFRPDIMAQHMLPAEDVGIKKMGSVPHINKETQGLEFWNLNTLQFGDFMMISLAHNFPELTIITNDSALFKTGDAALDGRAISFHGFINTIPYWKENPDWQKLQKWFNDNVKSLRNNSSWKLEKRH